MRTRLFYILVVFLSCMSFSSYAQLQVLGDGRVQIGTLKEDEDLLKATTLQVLGSTGTNRAGAKLAFGDFGRYTHLGWNVFVGEYGSDDTDQLWLHGKKGIYLTSDGQANNIIGYYNPSVNTNFVFNTNLRVNGINITSDARLKENVQLLDNSLELLSDINAVTYNYKLSELPKISSSTETQLTGQNDQNSFASSTSEKEHLDKQYQEEIDKKISEEASRKHIGFLAQDVQKVLPELVHTDDKGIMSIDYIGFIPILVESIKEMRNKIEEQELIIEKLQSKLLSEGSSISISKSINSMLQNAKLYNKDMASVSYKIDMDFSTANLFIYNLSGQLLKNLELESPQSDIYIDRNELGIGTFIYVLIVDGKKVDTLKKHIN
ncbi:MAG: tail fiber domain-containing protein [Parabacteroides sp.]|uniref:Tail fiber domain-containing protein n=1 Tax=Parabacteroides faecalis TaxID=2924040 RepID=A0ABT0C4J9_9BACT|nr:tail fiber domain-containing protein [Parabacteroides faecalis]MCI7287486.1 tail fiber domain-containing protein [Parabacteroides sp.]MDY5621893.1 tail fiber domain-containing protein [Bacteroidales bacterium]MCI7707440.1 tail fiber domain-containing protein [Parabacteroides sp.]MCJ2381936.1 tail fiber domain-containing protein [Parabacteroides faecalis]MDD7560724.1 tail fiber domain-containing protein [Parabacteroides sp.]